MNHRREFTVSEWELLQFAPFFVLSGVAGRYRSFVPAELLLFERWLGEASRAPGAVSREILSSVHVDLDGVLARFETYDATIVSGLTSVADVLERRDAGETALFRRALIDVLGLGLATARGPYGQQPTLESEQMLVMMEEFLRPGVSFPVGSGAA